MNDERRPARNAAATQTTRADGTEGNGALRFEIALDAFDVLVARVTDRVLTEVADSSPWMNRHAAAGYLDVPVSRLEKDRTVPTHRWDGRILYNRHELDEWLMAQ